jgi:hypothetical protein
MVCIYGVVKLRWRNKQVCTLEEYTNISHFPILFVEISNQHIEKNGEKKNWTDSLIRNKPFRKYIYICIRLLFFAGSSGKLSWSLRSSASSSRDQGVSTAHRE